jgi:pimeloyl-ACP methyl ester carboxylesterase
MNMLNRAAAFTLLSLGACTAAHAADFRPCDDAATDPALNGSLCAVERVPADPSGAAGTSGEVALFVRKFPALGARRGQAWLVAGGPGESGAAFYGLLPTLREAFPGFDLLVPDHRGTGFSTRMCAQEEAPASPGGTALAGAEWGSCFAHLNAEPAFTRQFSLTNAAHDLKLLLERGPREGKTYVLGVSYGTELVLRTLAIGVDRVDGVVLDSLVPLQDDATADLSRRSLVTDAVGRAWLARCDAQPQCSAQMGEPAETAYRRLLARIGQDKALLETIPGKNLRRLFGSMLDVPPAAAMLPQVIKDLNEGGQGRLTYTMGAARHYASTFRSLPQSPMSIPLVALISGSENNLRPGRTLQEVKAEEEGLLFVSELPARLVEPGLPLYARDKYFGQLPQRLPRTLVLQSALDAKTPYAAAMRHVEALRRSGPVELTRIEHGAHFTLWSMPGCFVRSERAFVLETATPAPACDLQEVYVTGS